MGHPRVILMESCSDTEIREAVELLRKGALAIFATDTVYGIGCDARLPDVVAKVFAAKRRDPSKQLPIFVGGVGEILQYIPDAAREAVQRLAAVFWPGALTIVTDVVQQELYTQPPSFGPATSIGFRVPGCQGLLRLLSCGLALAQTSLNESGEPVISNLGSARAQTFLEQVDLVLDSKGPFAGHPSTVVRVGPGRWEVLREGSIPEGAIRAVLRSQRDA